MIVNIWVVSNSLGMKAYSPHISMYIKRSLYTQWCRGTLAKSFSLPKSRYKPWLNASTTFISVFLGEVSSFQDRSKQSRSLRIPWKHGIFGFNLVFERSHFNLRGENTILIPIYIYISTISLTTDEPDLYRFQLLL